MRCRLRGQDRAGQDKDRGIGLKNGSPLQPQLVPYRGPPVRRCTVLQKRPPQPSFAAFVCFAKMGDIGKSFERLMRCANNLMAIDGNTEPNIKGASHAYNESLRAVHESFQRIEARMNAATDDAGRHAPARAWLSAHLERKLFFRLEMLFITIRENAEVATGSSDASNAVAR